MDKLLDITPEPGSIAYLSRQFLRKQVESGDEEARMAAAVCGDDGPLCWFLKQGMTDNAAMALSEETFAAMRIAMIMVLSLQKAAYDRHFVIPQIDNGVPAEVAPQAATLHLCTLAYMTGYAAGRKAAADISNLGAFRS